MEILVLCTGNICRSPMGEVLMAREADNRATDASVASAGFVTEDRAAEPAAVAVMADRGLSLDTHRSRLVTPAMMDGADLVIGMTREHVRQASNLGVDLFPKTFTLKELTRRGTEVGADTRGDLDAWLAMVNEDRAVTELLGSDPVDDIADPMGRSVRRFRACADEIEQHVEALADLLWPDLDP